MLKVDHLRKVFASVVAVDDVSFEIQPGEIFGLLGPNGAGKTTTIRIILNILEADSGTVSYRGMPFSDAVRNGVGYLPEERGLYRKSKLLDTILYFGELRGLKRSTAKSEALRWLERFSLLEYRERKVEELSKGNQQKVQFITAIIHDPPLLILDEPFSGLDPVNQILFKDIFQEVKQAGKAIVFSTHQMDQAERLSDALCLINKGRVVLDGSVRDVKKRYGTNTAQVEFDGDGSFMNSLPGVRRAIMYENAAELELEPDAHTQQILAAINGKVELRKFEILEPSLQSIFIQIVGTPEKSPAPEVAR
ncbi:MAG TPA: ATP-binding cassette domain-containing protein [Bacteroidota bacterium]|nr:ATP-binding cassette domain-containing protein [Bacteroidota bacterium]